ncbi:glycosyltransferase [Verrucomicrobia bacterium S94]|nr:glycosyltransferase [Verrucomicrobia bacterium S94]
MLDKEHTERRRTNVLGVGVSSLNMNDAVQDLLVARARGQKGYVCVTGVHGVIESQRDPELRKIHNRSFLTVPDGMPTVWMGREQGFTKMGRVYGPDLMLRVFEATANPVSGRSCEGMDRQGLKPEAEGVKRGSGALESNYLYPSQDETGGLDVGAAVEDEMMKSPRLRTHFLYGATEEVLVRLKRNLETRFPGVQIVGMYAPPFRALNEGEEEELRKIVSECKPDFFWVGLSTPKQEKFMSSHDPRLSDPNYRPHRSGLNEHPLEAGIMLGVGAAFPIHAGLQKDAPEWIKNSGLQWLYRLCQDPKRLWRRYLYIVPVFLWLATLQVLGIKTYEISSE